jgi:threonine dehydratase
MTSPAVTDPSVELPVSYADVLRAHERLRGVAHRTPIARAKTLDRVSGCQVFLKCENLQRTGAFKFRGAFNAVRGHASRRPGVGVLAASSGNHGQAVALAGQLLGVHVTVVMPEDAPRVKLEATRAYGAEIVLYDRARETREAVAARVAEERSLDIVHAYDDPAVIAGQGTAVKELIEDAGELDVLLVCVGGGGLLSGSALAARALSPACRVIGVEPELADDAARTFRTGRLQTVHNPPTIADGARTPSLGKLTMPLVLALADDVVTVSERAIVEAMRFCWERLKLVVEPTGALALAALLDRVVEPEARARVGVTLSGGNVDLDRAAELFAAAK